MLFNYLGAVMKHWMPLLLGVFGTIPWCLRAILSPHFQEKMDYYLNPSALRWLGLISIIISFVSANYLAWKDQKEGNIELTAKLNGLGKPHLVGQILANMIGSTEDGSTSIFILISITNTGSPSVVDRWQLSITNARINYNGILPSIIPPHVNLFKDDEKQIPLTKIVDPSDAILDKTMVPIKKGDMVRGWLWFVLKNTNKSELIPGTTLTVSFQDYINNAYSTNIQVREGSDNERPMYFPGTKNPFQQKP